MPDAPSLWIAEASDFFSGGQLNPTLDLGDLLIHVVPTQWCAMPFYWNDVQEPHILPEHLAVLEEELARRPAALHAQKWEDCEQRERARKEVVGDVVGEASGRVRDAQ